MPTNLITNTAGERDGTSQLGRAANALSPEYVSVDERNVEDLLSFVREYAKTLVHFDNDDSPSGDFTAFLGSLSPREVAAFLAAPEKFDAQQSPALFRPHFTLFLAFLRLFQDAQTDLNAFTRRHLDFHYRRFLRMQPRDAVPDQVNLLFTMVDHEQYVRVPVGTAVSAGMDSLGRELLYRTHKDFIANRARIDKMSSLFLDRKLISVEKSWHDHPNDPEAGRFEMLRIAYGRPLPGDPLPDYPGTPPTRLDTDDALDTKLEALKTLVAFSQPGLFLSLGELRSLMTLTEVATTASATNKRDRYVAIIEQIWSNGHPGQTRVKQSGEADLSFDAFANAVLGALSIAGQPQVTTLRGYWNALLEVEGYFGLPIESFEVLITKILAADWDGGYERDGALVARLLEQAYHEKLRNERIAALQIIRDAHPATTAYTAILQHALYENNDSINTSAFDDTLEDELRAYLTETDVAKLQAAHAASKWNDVYALLAHAMAKRTGKHPPRKTVWRNLFPADNALTVIPSRARKDASDKFPFATFGAPSAIDAATPPPAPVLGFAITSPILALSSGTRTITLTLGLRASGFEFEQLKKAFNDWFGQVDTEGRNLSPIAIEVSTAKGWRRVASVTYQFGVYDTLVGASNTTWHDHATAPGLRLVLTLAEGDPPIVPLPSAPDGMDARWPALRILMLPVWSATEKRYRTYYRELASLFVGAVFVKVNASGLVPSAIENDDSMLNPKKPFEPFGLAPAIGSTLSIGHPELVTKKIDRVKLTYQWMGAPSDVRVHYTNYPGVPTSGTYNFASKLRWLDISGPKQLATPNLFATDPRASTIIDCPIATPLGRDHLALVDADSSRMSTWKRRLQWVLDSNFFHKEYPSVATKKSLDLSLKLAKGTFTTAEIADPATTMNAYQVNPPYTPKLTFLTLEYDSSIEIHLFRNEGEKLDRAYHVHPFGVAELSAASVSDEMPFMPRYDAESELCIGLANVSLPETITLLFQLDEGSADRDIEPPKVTWSQLSGNRWIPLGRNVLSDATRGFQTSGIVELALQRAEPSTLLPAGLTWVRASISQDHASICDTRAVFAQAVMAAFDDQNNAPEHYRAPLPAGTITKLKSPIAGIASVAQPYPSYGGRPAEAEATFATRVSERLRHKQRALSSWDYERIVLDAFPQIFKTKCIPTSDDEPGQVDVLVIPDVRILPTNELGPKAPIALLSEIEGHLAARTPACVEVNVRNAVFRAVRLRLGVRFTEVGNDGYWMGRLNEELNRFLSPWAYDEGADIVIGAKIYASNIVDFVDRRPYVDYLAGITLFYTDDEGKNFTFLRPHRQEGGAYCVEAGDADCVLVAYPKHRIDVLTTEHYDARLYQGISYMELGMDFEVG